MANKKSLILGTNGHNEELGSTDKLLGTTEDYIYLRYYDAAGGDGGTFTSGGWRTVPLNDEAIDTGNNATIGSNQFTLLAGTYRISASAVGFDVDEHQAALYNVTDASYDLYGSSENAGAGSSTSSFIVGRFTIASSKTFEIRHYCTASQTKNGFGVGNTDLESVFLIVELWKEIV